MKNSIPSQKKHNASIYQRHATKLKTGVCAVISALAFQLAHADIPDRPATHLGGMYKVASSSDPLFPMNGQQEWFLDFGKGMSDGSTSGKVAVSLRQNPKVSIRIMVWQYFPEQGALLIGNQTEEGSRQAVARAVWSLANDSGKVVLLRDNSALVLNQADQSDY
ncbi:hypothetical protein ACFSSA_08510 [Luteolibacter algae]|uniref:Uncharacterized protein n=1 Tax=Luteolibacter algae TaxID=454151 RepID=A0ABW5D7H7_9BACT